MITPVSFLDNLLRILHAGRLGPHPAQCGRQLGISGLLVGVMLVIVMGGCGLPDYISIGKPTKATAQEILADMGGTIPSSCLAFKTPTDVSDIQGYVVYYKIYTDSTDFNDEEDEATHFNENTYINSSDEMPIGSTLPLRRGFVKAGLDGQKSYQSMQIQYKGTGDEIIYIDFDHGQDRGIADSTSEIPRAGDSYPVPDYHSTLEPYTRYLARGVVDDLSTDVSIPQDVFLPFVGEWDWNSTTSSDSVQDADMYRKTYLTSSSTVSDVVASLKTGTALLDGVASPQPQILIGVVVYSRGMDPATLTPLYSKPEYIGTITYQSVNDKNRSR